MSEYRPPPELPREMETILPHSARRRRFMPVVDGVVTVSLPGEQICARVKGVVTPDEIVVEIEDTPMARGHTYRKGNLVPCRRVLDDFLKVEKWEAVSEHELSMAEAAERFRRDEQDRAAREQAEIDAKRTRLPAPA